MAVNKDTVVGIVGAAILVAAMVGVFYYEASQGAGFGATAFAASYPASAASLDPITGATREGDSTVQNVNVSATNLTSIQFSLEWTDDEPDTGADRFRLIVESPSGRVFESDEGGSPRVINLDAATLGQSVPEARSVVARDESDASRQASVVGTAGTGVWKVTIELVEAGDGVCQAPVGCLPGQEDTQNSWTLKTSFTRWELQIQGPAGDE